MINETTRRGYLFLDSSNNVPIIAIYNNTNDNKQNNNY